MENPSSIRAKFGYNLIKNAAHGASSSPNVGREIAIMCASAMAWHRLRLGAERAIVRRRIPSVLHKDGFHLPVDPTDSNCKLRGSVAFAASRLLMDGGVACRQRLQVEGPDVGVKCAWRAMCRGATRGACAWWQVHRTRLFRDSPLLQPPVSLKIERHCHETCVNRRGPVDPHLVARRLAKLPEGSRDAAGGAEGRRRCSHQRWWTANRIRRLARVRARWRRAARS